MNRTNWILGLALLAVATAPGSAWGQDGEPIVVRAVFHDSVGVPAEIAERARNEVRGIFRRSNITFAWIDSNACEGSCLNIKVVSKPLGDKSRYNPKVVGMAPGTLEFRGRLAYIFYERIRVYSGELGMDTAQMLGHVIAHEIGHLLLPYGAHSVAGIMRAEWDRRQVSDAAMGTLRFTPVQAELIRTRLQASASPIASAR